MLFDAIIAAIIWGIQPIFIAKSLPILPIEICCLLYIFTNIIFCLYLRYIKEVKITLSNKQDSYFKYAIFCTIVLLIVYIFGFKNAHDKSFIFIAITYSIPILLSSLFISWYKKITINIQSYICLSLIMGGIYTLTKY